MLTPRRATLGATALALTARLASLTAGEPRPEQKKPPPLTGRTPTELPRIPPPDPKAAFVPPGFAVEVVTANLTYPTSIEFDDRGALYVAEAGYAYGDEAAPARVTRIVPAGPGVRLEVVAD